MKLLSTFCELLRLDGGVMGGQGNKNMVRKMCELKCRLRNLFMGLTDKHDNADHVKR